MNLLTSLAADKFRLSALDERFGDQEIKLSSVNSRANPAFDLIGLTKLRNDPQFAGIDGSGFSIAIIDTGIDTTHPLLADNYIAGYDFIDDNNNLKDNHGHGTHVTGTIGATDPNIGVATDVGLIGLKTLNDKGTGSLSDVEDSLEWVLANQKKYNITAVNLSFGIGHFTPESGYSGDILSDDIERLEEAGVTVISATGNNYFATSGQANQANISFPAVASTIAVGAVWQDNSRANFQLETGSKDFSTDADRIASFSQRLDTANVVFAPGAVITSTVSGGGLGGRAGTSQAAPHVAGVVALMQEASMQFNQRLLTPDEIINILSTTGDTIFDGDDEDDNVVNTNTEYSRINAYQALVKVKSIGVNTVPTVIDLNGTLAGARTAGLVDGKSTKVFTGNIGRDKTTIRDNDVDIYSFELATTGIIGLELNGDLQNRADFNSYLRLFDNVGNQIAFNDDASQNNRFSRLDINLEPGKYHVGVSGSKNSNYNPNIAGSGVAADTGNYRLEFSLSHLDSNGIISNAQPISLENSQNSLVFGGNIGLDQDKLIGTGDVDLFKIVAPDNGVLFLDIDTPYENNFVNSWLRIFDQSGNELIFAENQQAANNNDGLAFDLNGQPVEFVDSNNTNIILDQKTQTNLRSGLTNNGEYEKGNYGHSSDSFIAAQVNQGDIYFVGVSDYANRDYNANSLSNRPQSGQGGQYELVTTFINEDDIREVSSPSRSDRENEIKDSPDTIQEETLLPMSDRENEIKDSPDTIQEETPLPVGDRENEIKDSPDPVKEETPLPGGDRENEIKDSPDPVKEETPLPVSDRENEIKDSPDTIQEETPLPMGDRENEIKDSPDPVKAEIPTLISDDALVSGSTVHRFFRADLGVHFYTTDEIEKDVIENTLPQFNYEGASFIAADSSTDSLTGIQPVHRFLNTSTGAHLYTTDETEREFVGNSLDNYDYEGVAYHVYESEISGTTPLYRFYNTDTNAHFYTPDLVEKDFINSNLPSYQLEGNNGIAFYVESI